MVFGTAPALSIVPLIGIILPHSVYFLPLTAEEFHLATY